MSLGYPAFEPLIQVADVTGAAYAGAKANFYVAGSSTRANTYTTRTVGSAGTPNANPVVADANGRFPAIFLDPDVIYKVDITNSADVSIPRYPIDNVQVEVKPTQIDIGTTLWPRTQAEIDASVTPANLFHQPGWVERYLTNSSPGTTDMAAGFTNAFKQAKETDGAPVRGDDTYKLESTVNCREAKVDLRDSTIDIAHTGIGIIAGGDSDGPTNPEQRFGTVLRSSGSDSATNPTIKIMGAYGQHIHIHYTGYIQLYADSDDGAVGYSDAIAYSTFWFNRMTTMEWNTKPIPSVSTTQWINENTFYLNRMATFICDGTYPHNNNRLWGGNMEAPSASVGATITLTKGHTNTWNDIRFERTGTRPFVEMTFGAASYGNKIFQSWVSSLSDYTTETIYGNTAFDKVTDAGYNNQVLKTSSMSRQTFVIAHASIDDPIFDTTVGQTFGSGFFTSVVTSPADLKPSLFSLQTVGSNDYIMSTDLFRVKRGDIIGWNTETFSSVSPGYRSYFYCYDEDGAEILPVVSSGAADMSTDNCFSGQLSASAPNRLGPTGNNSKESVTILGPNIAFIKIVWLSGSAASTTNTARSITAYIRRGMSMATENITQTCVPDVKQKFLGVSGVPTQGFAKVGYSVCDIDGSHHVVDRSIDTELTTAATSSSGSIIVADATSVASGDIVGILNDAELVTDWTTCDGTVTGSGPYTVPIAGTPTGACAIGNRVVILHWISE